MQARIEEDGAESSVPTPADDYWRALAEAGTAEEYCHAWLSVLCGKIPHAHAGLLLAEDVDGSYATIALWPWDTDPAYLSEVASEALSKRQGAVHRDPPGKVRLAYPLLVGDRLYGAVVLDLRAANDVEVAEAMRLVHWGAGWLIDLFNRRAAGSTEDGLDRSSFLLDLALGALSEDSFKKAAQVVVDRLAQRFDCDQVQLGLEKGRTVRVAAMSHSAWFENKANLVNLAAQAMNEAFDQRSLVAIPEPERGRLLVTAAHRRYGKEGGSEAICSVPMEAGNRLLGVCLLERADPFTQQEQDMLETLALMLGPILDLKLGAEEGLFKHVRRSWEYALRRIVDTSRPGIKLLVVAGALAIGFVALYQTDYRVAAPAYIEGEVQRVAVAPFDGYVREALVHAGDMVREGQVMARLEDKDLQLERVRWEAELEVAQRKEREAMSNGERVALRLASAQGNQARAQLDLVEEKLERVQLAAPFDGLVVRGDLSQRLGSPVEQGEVLFEVAPLDVWRVILRVDERDIADVHEGQGGELVLTSLPGRAFRLLVKTVTPVAAAEEGRNRFRVEAAISEAAPELRPGMEGVGKVDVDKRSLLWIWTHRLVDWVWLTLWEWMP